MVRSTMPAHVSRSVVSCWILALAVPSAALAGCDTEAEEGLFGASAAGPSTPTSGTGGDAEDPDTEGASEGSRADTGAGDSSGAGDPPPDSPADSNADPMPPPPADDSGGGTFDPLDDGGTDAGGSTSLSDDDGAASSGGGMASSCCAAGAGVGCSDPAVEACVCGQDPFCCDTQWDDVCAESADLCGGNCGGGGAGGACCMVQAGPGCADPATESCVCLFDAFCCTMQWDDVCVQEAQVDCGAVC
jgi:hypothetical protein